MKNYLLTSVLLVLTLNVYAQKMPFKFGDIDKKDLEMTIYPLDSGADAVVLADYGNSTFHYDKNDGFYFVFERTTRTKIFNSDGYEYANVEIPIYHGSGGTREILMKSKGFTYNLENGKITKSKLNKDGRFTEDYSDNWIIEKFTMPDVREGSVIEYQYSIKSPYWSHLRTWEFQKEIPVRFSECYYTIPEYFDYQQLTSGYHPLSVIDQKSVSGKINFVSVERKGTYTVRSQINNSTVNFRQTQYHRLAENVPAFKKEAYMNGVNNYITKIEFELRGTKFPYQPYEPRIGTWPDLNKTFLDADNFGDALRNDGFLKDVLQPIDQLGSAEEKIQATVDLIRSEVEWNDKYRYVVSSPLRKVWNEKKGSSAEINLMVVAALRRLGIDANPVLISTRNHGLIREHFAISSQFNSIVVIARFDDKSILLDATDKYLPVGVLPEACINGKGFVISESDFGWISIQPTVKSESLTSAKMSLEETGALNGTITTQLKGYRSFDTWKKYLQVGKEEFIKDLQSSHKTWQIHENSLPEEINTINPFKQEHEVSLENATEVAGNLIFINPMISFGIGENPFKLEERKYPVDFIYPRSNIYMFSLTIPENYAIDEIPESEAISLPNSGGLFQYNVMSTGNTLNVICKYSIDKPLFLPHEYAALKEFFNIIINKQSSQVVLKKKT